MGGTLRHCGCTVAEQDGQSAKIPVAAPHRAAQTDTEVLNDLKALLQSKFKSRAEAFDKLGGNDDSRIEFEEFRIFVSEHLGFEGDARRCFKMLDIDSGGFITKGEFKTLTAQETRKSRSSVVNCNDSLKEFKDFMKRQCSDPKGAFASLDVNDDHVLDYGEFEQLLLGKIKYQGNVKELFQLLDKDHNGYVTWVEFKTVLGIGAKRGSMMEGK